MKILFLSQSSPLREGGIETRCREIATRLVEQGHEVDILCAKTSPGESAEEIVKGVRIFRKKVVPEWWLARFPFPHYSTLAAANLLMMFHLRRLLRREKFDVLREDIAPVPVSGFLSFRRLPLHRIGMIHMLPGSWKQWVRYYGFFFGSVGHFNEILMAKGFMKFQKFILAVQGPVGRLSPGSEASKKVEFIPNGVDLARFGKIPKPGRAEPSPLRILSIGRLVKTKGQRYLIEALALLLRHHPGVRLTLVGQGPLKSRLISLAERLGVREAIDFIDLVPFEKMPEFIVDFDVLAMPSIFEGFNIVVLEAMASGLPVILSDISGFRDIASEGEARFFQPENPAGIAEALAWLIADPRRLQELSAKGKDRVKAYHWERCAMAEALVYSTAP